jgi:Na+(H+)/acetate symporter ActP
MIMGDMDAGNWIDLMQTIILMIVAIVLTIHLLWHKR